jgi:hypothetical protein
MEPTIVIVFLPSGIAALAVLFVVLVGAAGRGSWPADESKGTYTSAESEVR